MSDETPPLPQLQQPSSLWRELWTTEDWWAVWLGLGLLLGMFATIRVQPPVDATTKAKATTALSDWIVRPKGWTDSPLESIVTPASEKDGKAVPAVNRWPALAAVAAALGLLLTSAGWIMGRDAGRFALGFLGMFALATVSFVLAEQAAVKYYNLEFVMWALFLGLLLSNVVGVPQWIKAAASPEFYIKTGLVLLGVDVLLDRLLQLGPPGVMTSWIVTPVVLISTYLFGQYVLRIASKSLNLVISADMSVCGVSAAIATASACKAKKEELSLAVGLSLVFTAVMMVVQPVVARQVGMDPYVAGAWIGGTIDATGAVAAAGNILATDPRPGDTPGQTTAEAAAAQARERKAGAEVAVVVKMIQNTLIGVISFCVAVYWVTCVEPSSAGQRPSLFEVWKQFPKFSLGFVGASILFTILSSQLVHGDVRVETLSKSAKTLREWLFCLGFVSIGLETNFKELAQHLKGGKPLILYLVGQSLNLILTYLMAALTFGYLYRDYVRQIMK